MLHPHQEDLNNDSEEEDQDVIEFELQAKAEEEALALPKKVDTATKFNHDSEDDDDFLADPPAKDDDVHSLASHLSLDAVE